jgi:hypothetical protein
MAVGVLRGAGLRIRSAVLGAALAGAVVLLAAAEKAPTPAPTGSLPELGTVLHPLPDGPGKSVADAACLNCHSSDILRQQRLTEKQWQASVTKMIGWGAVVPDDQRDALIAYLVQNFGPDNDRFEPVSARPVGR